MAQDPLAPFYPKWRDDALESARWILSGREYEEWCAERGMHPLPQETRESRAREYRERAEKYTQPMGGN